MTEPGPNYRAREFWGEQGRYGAMTRGIHERSYLYAYPESVPGNYTIVIYPSPVEPRPGDLYIDQEEDFFLLIDTWGVEWFTPEDKRVEVLRREIGWPPLSGSGR